MNTRRAIDDFLFSKRIAFVGLSTDPKDFSHAVFTALRQHGIDVVPVNPRLESAEGVRCFASLAQIDPRPDGVLVMTPPAISLEIARQAIDLGIGRIWFHRGVGAGSVHPDAVALCIRAGMTVVAGECPLMFLGHPSFIHRAHGVVKQVLGTYPQ